MIFIYLLILPLFNSSGIDHKYACGQAVLYTATCVCVQEVDGIPSLTLESPAPVWKKGPILCVSKPQDARHSYSYTVEIADPKNDTIVVEEVSEVLAANLRPALPLSRRKRGNDTDTSGSEESDHGYDFDVEESKPRNTQDTLHSTMPDAAFSTSLLQGSYGTTPIVKVKNPSEAEVALAMFLLSSYHGAGTAGNSNQSGINLVNKWNSLLFRVRSLFPYPP